MFSRHSESPARKATVIFTKEREFIFPPALVPKFNLSKNPVIAGKFAIFDNSPTKIRTPIIIRRTPKKYSKYYNSGPILAIKRSA